MKRGIFINNISLLNKKSQITIIIIIAIILVIVIILLVLIKPKINQQKEFPSIFEINNKLQECFNQRSLDAVYLVGLQGGYTKLPENSENYLKTSLYSTTYGLKDNKNVLPSLITIEKEISNLLELTLPFCIEDSDFPELNLNYEIKNVNIKIKENVISEIIIKLSAMKDGKSFTLDKTYSSEIQVRLKQVHATANEIIKKHLENPEFIDLSFLTEQEFDITFSHYDEITLIYVITDSEFDNELDDLDTYSFMFGVEGK